MTDDAYKAHVFLREIRKLNILLEINELEQADWRNKAQGCGSFSADFKVQTSPRSDAMEKAVIHLVELEDEHEQLLGALYEKLETAIMLLDGLTTDEVSILRLYYFSKCTDERTGEIMHLTRSRITQLRHQALEKIGRVLKD